MRKPSGVYRRDFAIIAGRNTGEQNPTLERLEQQISWYDSKSMRNQKWFKGTRIVALIAGALVPILALIDANRLAIAAVGFLLVVLEGLQQLNLMQTGFRTVRLARLCETREFISSLAKAGP